MEQKLFEKANGRQTFYHQGQLIYEWLQTLDELHIFIQLPNPTIKKTDLCIEICPRKLSIGLKNNTPYIDAELWSAVDTSESVWYIDGKEIVLECSKAKKGETWAAAFKGHGSLDPLSQQEVQKKMMLERFQEEHPGFDFSSAQFSGTAPDPRTFMGGISYK